MTPLWFKDIQICACMQIYDYMVGKHIEKIPGCYCWALKEWKGTRGEKGKKNNFIVKYAIICNINVQYN